MSSSLPEAPDVPARVLPPLCVVIPALDAAEWMPRTIAALDQAVEHSPWHGSARIIVVDDGSTDGTADAALGTPSSTPVEIVSQSNRGRFAARATGLATASPGDFVLFCDSRVIVDPDALRFLAEQVLGGRCVWNGHAETGGSSLYPRFWDAITHVAWRRYYRSPKTTSYGASDFDHFPKGTTCFFGPRDVLVAAFDAFDSGYDDLSRANDDTSVIRWIAERNRIWISPSFRCTYHGRTSFEGFLRHSYHRGTVLVDGYLRTPNRYRPAIVAFLAVSPFVAIAALRAPKATLLALVVGDVALGASARVLGAAPKEATALSTLAPVFGVCYGAGIWRGVAMLGRARLHARRSR